jgi:hypothetical protein
MARDGVADQAHRSASTRKGVVRMADTVTITFSGICTHFWNFVAGVPMRTVVPSAQGVFFGAIRTPNGQDPPVLQDLSYLIMPHVPMVIYLPLDAPPNTPRSTLLTGCSLTINNAMPSTISTNQTPEQPAGGFKLTEFVESFVPSNEVVSLYNRAAAYFDIDLASSVTIRKADPLQENSPLITIVEIETNGPPVLQIDRFPNSLMAMSQQLITLQPSSSEQGNNRYVLSVTNPDLDPTVANRNFDFLLNYLVGAAGLPLRLDEPTPGMLPLPLASPTPTNIRDDFASFTDFLTGGLPTGSWISEDYLQQLWNIGQLITAGPMPDSESCSDSHYP